MPCSGQGDFVSSRAYCVGARVCPAWEEGWSPWAASGHQVLSRVLSHVSNLRETRSPTLPLACGQPDEPPVFLPPPFPGTAWPDLGLCRPLAVWPVSTLAAPSRAVVASSIRCLGLFLGVSRTHGEPGRDALGCCFEHSVQRWVLPGLPCPPDLDVLTGLSAWGLPLQGEGALCQSRASALDFPRTPHAPAHGSGHGTVLRKFSVNAV